jgi:hypothetical protein
MYQIKTIIETKYEFPNSKVASRTYKLRCEVKILSFHLHKKHRKV